MPQESINEFRNRVLGELDSFYRSGPYKYDSLHIDRYIGVVDPSKLPVESGVLGNSNEEFYFEKLLPAFLKFAKDEGTNLNDWDRRQTKTPFNERLKELVESFNEIITPCVYGGRIFFVRCEPKEISGLPHDAGKREDFIETKSLFNYRYYAFDEKDAFKLFAYYTNLHAEYEHAIKSKTTIGIIAFIVGIVLAILIMTAS